MVSPDFGTVIDAMVCLATVTPPRLVTVQVPAQTAVTDAMRAPDLPHGLDLTINTCRLGAYGKHKTPDVALHTRDWVEILDPLIADPKMARRQCVQKARATGTRGRLKWLRNKVPSKDGALE